VCSRRVLTTLIYTKQCNTEIQSHASCSPNRVVGFGPILIYNSRDSVCTSEIDAALNYQIL
jgi:hypothetical protein